MFLQKLERFEPNCRKTLYCAHLICSEMQVSRFGEENGTGEQQRLVSRWVGRRSGREKEIERERTKEGETMGVEIEVG